MLLLFYSAVQLFKEIVTVWPLHHCLGTLARSVVLVGDLLSYASLTAPAFLIAVPGSVDRSRSFRLDLCGWPGLPAESGSSLPQILMASCAASYLPRTRGRRPALMSSRTSLLLRQVIFMRELRGNLTLHLLLCALLSPTLLPGSLGWKGRAGLTLPPCVHCGGAVVGGRQALQGNRGCSAQSVAVCCVLHRRPLAGDAPGPVVSGVTG